MSLLGVTGGNSGASDSAVSLVGADNAVIARDNSVSLGQSANLNQGVQFGNTQGSVTIGETGLGTTFANAIKDVTEKNTAALSSLITGNAQSKLPGPSDLDGTSETILAESGKTRRWLLIGGGVVLALLVVLFFLRRK
jgi:hypothetical protein